MFPTAFVLVTSFAAAPAARPRVEPTSMIWEWNRPRPAVPPDVEAAESRDRQLTAALRAIADNKAAIRRIEMKNDPGGTIAIPILKLQNKVLVEWLVEQTRPGMRSLIESFGDEP